MMNMPGHIESRAQNVTAQMLPHTYREGCPVALSDLRAVSFDHLGFDDAVREGTLIVHRMISAPILEAFTAALEMGFPIRQAIPIDDPAFKGDDFVSMAANNTSCFNYRSIAGTDRVSMHSWGLAVDINPALNPYLAEDGVWYPDTSHLDRSARPGVFTADHPLTKIFEDLGFEWGGSWPRPDYHHFQWSRGTAP